MPIEKNTETTTNVAEENTIKKQLASALSTELENLGTNTNIDFKEFINKFVIAMSSNKIIAKNEKNYGFEKSFNSSYKIDKPRNKSETEMLFYNIKIKLNNIHTKIMLPKMHKPLCSEDIEGLTTALDAVSTFNKNRKALICQGNLKETFGKLKTKTEELWEKSPLNPANKT